MVRDLSWFRDGSSMFYHGFVMVRQVRDVLFSTPEKGHVTLYSQSECQIHYQISFLMRLLICPFPFKEHTSKSAKKTKIHKIVNKILKDKKKMYKMKEKQEVQLKIEVK